MCKTRNRYKSTDKVKILREHLVDNVPISEICEKYGISPVSFYEWQKKLFENSSEVFDSNSKKTRKAEEERVKKLEKKLQKRDEVIAELMSEHVKVKKNLGIL